MISKRSETVNLKNKGAFTRLPADVIVILRETKLRTGLPLQKIISESIKVAAPILKKALDE
jgi:hypothetical protein